MLDLGWGEIAVIALVAIIVLGPKELPHALKSMGRAMRKVREISRDFQGHVDDMVREAELDDVRKQLEDVRSKGIANTIQDQIDPKRELDMNFDAATGAEIKKPAPEATPAAAPAIESQPAEPLPAPVQTTEAAVPVKPAPDGKSST